VIPVTVLDHPRVRGGCFTVEASRAALEDALTRVYSTDAHLQLAIAPRWGHRRLTRDDIGRTPIELRALAIDLDMPDHAPITPEFCAAVTRAWEALSPPRRPFCSFTRHGARWWWLLAELFAIATDEDAATYRARYLALCDELERTVLGQQGLACDRSCSDWQRLHRAPHATRDACGLPEELPMLGAPNAVGVIELPPLPSTHTTVAGRRPAIKRTPGAPLGALFDALDEAGLIVRQRDAESFVITCPRGELHTTGLRGDGSTLLWLPKGPEWTGPPGWIDCKHNGCCGIRDARSWRRAIAKLSSAMPAASAAGIVSECVGQAGGERSSDAT
jgi:hypothetical protein